MHIGYGAGRPVQQPYPASKLNCNCRDLIREESMTFKPKHTLLAASVAAMVVTLGSQAQAQQRYTVGSLAEGTTPFIVNTAWASAINKYMPGHKVTVSAVGAATKHSILVAQGKMDFTMYAPIQYRLLYKQIGPFKKITNGPELTEKISQLFSYPIGSYHAVVYESSGIKTFADIKGKKVFLGPPAGIATRNTKLIIDAMTGYKPGKDFQQVKMGWGAAAQAFQDRKIDVWISVTTSPSPSVSQLTLSNKIRLLSLDESKFDHPSWKKYISQPGRNMATIDPNAYGPNMTNTEP
ncbi:MAG: ABC transporter substrate-binding protein, partial [Alphaproteobacteria bacterium]|nr:ABC transporter substrate-binding protein [Alphaproteobacteria bacterium]